MRNNLAQLQSILGYQFTNFDNLELALTAAGADESNHDGNRRMAQLGEKLIEFLLAEIAYEEGASRANINKNIASAVAKEHRENVAKTIGIAPFVRCCPRQGDGPPSRTVLRLAISAIVWACWLDSARDVAVMYRVLHQLGFGLPSGSCLDPREVLTQWRTPLPDAQISQFSSDQASQDLNDNLLRLNQLNKDDTLCSLAGIFSANDAALPSLENSEITAIRQGDILNNELDEFNPYRFATSPCLSATESDNRASSTLESHMSHAEALQEESSQQPQERQESEVRPSDPNRPIKPTTGSPENGSSVATGSQLRTARANHETRRRRVEKPAPRHQSGRKPVQSTRRLVNRDKCHKTSSGKDSEQTEDEDETLTEQDISSISAFNLQEKRKCESQGYNYMDLLGSERAKTLLANSISNKQVLVLQSLLITLGGCNSLLSLKNILQEYRESHRFNPPAHTNNCSIAQRVKMIKRLGEKAAYCTFLKYCHIHKLFVDNSRRHCNTAEIFINSNSTDITRRSSRVRGNPLTVTEAQITKSMMQEVYPNVHPTQSDYNSRRREISGWRRAGRRFEQLVSRFNYGVLGLLPLERYNLNLVENIVFHLSDTRFQLLIEVLTANSGGFLKEFGRAATPIVVGIFENSIDASRTFNLEVADDNEIMGCPKGSPQLLELVSSVATSASPAAAQE